MSVRGWCSFALSLALVSIAFADEKARDATSEKNAPGMLKERRFPSITPIFGQLVLFSRPPGFNDAFENTNGPSYIREAILEGESVEKWSQMVTVTGAKGLASNPNVTPQAFAMGIGGGFKNSCPTSFSAIALGATKFGNHDAFVVWFSCGMAKPIGNPYSESMLLTAIKGKDDYYTVQWAERGVASATPIKFDETKWLSRFKNLMPIKLCPIVPGEPAPYLSCIYGISQSPKNPLTK